MAGRSEVSCNDGTFAVGAFAAAPPAITKDTPAAPNAGKPTRRRFRLETCFVRAIAKPPVRVRTVAHKQELKKRCWVPAYPRKLGAELKLRQATRL